MSSIDEDQEFGSEEALRELFRHGSHRVHPPLEDEQEIRAAVYAEWRQVTGKRRRNKRRLYWAAAASVVFATFLTWNTFRVPEMPVTAAKVERSLGDVYLRERGSGKLTAAKDPNVEVLVGQTIVTRSSSAVAIAWSVGGSLRLDQQTELLIVSPTIVELQAGRIYYDSNSDRVSAEHETLLTVNTDIGIVRHSGTQFMVALFDDNLTVSVREGLVSIDGARFAGKAVAGQKIELRDSGGHTVHAESGYGPEWGWIESIVPIFGHESRSILDFLNWVSRESGRQLRFESSSAESLAASEELVGPVEVEPTRALKIFLKTTDLKSEIVDDVISIRLAAAGE